MISNDLYAYVNIDDILNRYHVMSLLSNKILINEFLDDRKVKSWRNSKELE